MFCFQHVKEEDTYLLLQVVPSENRFLLCACSVSENLFDFDSTHLLCKLRNHVSSLTSLKQGTTHSTPNWLRFPSCLHYSVRNWQHDKCSRFNHSRQTEQSTASRSSLQPVPQPGQQRCLRSTHVCTGGQKEAGLRMAASSHSHSQTDTSCPCSALATRLMFWHLW